MCAAVHKLLAAINMFKAKFVVIVSEAHQYSVQRHDVAQHCEMCALWVPW